MEENADQRVHSVEQKCLEAGRECADEANSKLAADAPEAEVTRQLIEAMLAFCCQMPECFTGPIQDPKSLNKTNDDVAATLAGGVCRMCDDFKASVNSANDK